MGPAKECTTLFCLTLLRSFSMTLRSLVTSSKVFRFVLDTDAPGSLPSPFSLNPQGSGETNLVLKGISTIIMLLSRYSASLKRVSKSGDLFRLGAKRIQPQMRRLKLSWQ